jgi:hypothetical protein
MKLSLPISFAALILGFAGPLAAQTEDEPTGFFRVEAIVFTHAGGQSDAWPTAEPVSYAAAVDPAWQSFGRERERQRRSEEPGSRESEMAAALDVVEAIASLESGEETLTDVLLYPEPWLSLGELSEPMAQAAERLERSGAYRLQASLAWFQPVNEGARPKTVRIHDSTPIAVDWIRVTPDGRLLRNGRPIRAVEDLAPDFHYRLDGTIRLRQRQFMHADVSIDWRVPSIIGPSPWGLPIDGADLAVHRLDQSRTIRPGRFEYFDSPWLGLVLRVGPYEIEPEADSPEGGSGEP